MSLEIQAITAALAPPTQQTLDTIATCHEIIRQSEQIAIATEHVLHGGMYIRTIRLKPETVMEGSLIKLATVLIVHGSTAVLVGEGWVELEGYNVIPGRAGRKQVFVTRTEVEMTMIIPTHAKTVEEAEDEVFAEADLLMSRGDGSRSTVTITGE